MAATADTVRLIRESPGDQLRSNLRNYGDEYRPFTWEEARRDLSGVSEGRGLNIAYEAVDRHASGDRRDHVAICWLGRKQRKEYTYADLSRLSNRFADPLQRPGIQKGDRVCA
jgi:acetyl-CoA synthetase